MRELEADYVVIGAGVMGLAFVDALLTETAASVVLLDRRTAVGGHWREAYPFVRLHSPSSLYGVNSTPLGDDAPSADPLNAGLMGMAGRDEVVRYLDAVMRDRLLSSGRVTWLPGHDWRGDGLAVAMEDGAPIRLTARRRIIDATLTGTRTPISDGPGFDVEPGVRCIAPHDLPDAEHSAAHVVVGAGKTAIDTVLWLLQAGRGPETIRWIRPRDPWLLNRALFQPSRDFLAEVLTAWAGEMEAAAAAVDVDDLFVRWEAVGTMRRLDPAVAPGLFHCAFVSDAELERLRSVGDVVRRGRVQRIARDRIVLDQGEVPTGPDTLHIHCTASGIPRAPTRPVFQPGRINLHYVRRCAPPFSAALIARVEATGSDDDDRNALCRPVAMVDTPRDWVAAHLQDARARQAWTRSPELDAWVRDSRLDRFAALLKQAAAAPTEAEAAAVARWRAALAPGLEGLSRLLAASDLAPPPGA
ncbi:hypothetical protein [Brevundimonas aurifodinae]|uniref:NAD(P)/FAD-dependent oxidoreductase n=2 Tax=Brevundimonas TaxID=41275 RepID=A0ABV1NKK4_9CAUL|nr:MAG: hypothetical protein B7Z42_08575 [Brevundimonas sp. 12-68-7]OYX29699.1 MAG: hypothetical protein B7Z01_15430 [Brevundimonas subvibrioides]